MKINQLLSEWCEHLLSVQTDDGGFVCDACSFEHGRADNAVFPFLCMYSLTSDKKWLDGVRGLLHFRSLLTNDDGSVSNDFESPWKGITSFSAIGLYKALAFFGDIIPDEPRTDIEKCFKDSARWVHENIRPGFRANINYYCASAAVNAMYGAMYGDREYIENASELLGYCMAKFTENGILCGEGQPHDFVTARNCVPADIGYITEEAIPCLTDAAEALNDGECLEKIADYSVKLLEFMLPDGAWDNSFGSRNNKWTYYGSRTASGCAGAFLTLGRYRPELGSAALKNLHLAQRCTHDGVLYGGAEYTECGQKPCIHHTFSHALSVADAVARGFGDTEIIRAGEKAADNYCRYFPELDTYKIRFGDWLCTVTGNDYSTYTWEKGASHASGGTLSLLYRLGHGPVIAGSVSEYKRTETNNMQVPVGDLPHRPLLPRLEITRNGRVYSTALCFDSQMQVTETESGFTVTVKTSPETVNHEKLSDLTGCVLCYSVSENAVGISVLTDNLPRDAELVVPVISSSGALVTGKFTSKTPVFFLTGGFRADEYRFAVGNMDTVIRY